MSSFLTNVSSTDKEISQRIFAIKSTNFQGINSEECAKLIEELEAIERILQPTKNPRDILNLLQAYTFLFIQDKSRLPNKDLVHRALNTINFLLKKRRMPRNRWDFARSSLWLAAKWGFYDQDYIRECEYLLSESLQKAKFLWNIPHLTRMIWAYASLLETPQEAEEELIDLWLQRFNAEQGNLSPRSHFWGQLLPAMEFLNLELPNYSKELLVKNFLKLDQPHQSGFERKVAYVLGIMKISFETNTTILVYRPDFIIMRGGKRLVLECDGELFHPFPKTLRKKILLRRGYFHTIISGNEFLDMDFSQQLNLLWKIIHEFDQY